LPLCDPPGAAFIKMFTTVKTAETPRPREDIPAVETREYFKLY